MDLKYSCELCKFSPDYFLHLWKHRAYKHTEKASQSDDLGLALLAQQNLMIFEELATIKKNIKGSFGNWDRQWWTRLPPALKKRIKFLRKNI